MTAIVGFCRDGVVYMGGDSAGVNVSTYDMRKRADPKVFVNGEFLIGFTSSFRMGQLLRYVFVPPEIGRTQTIMEYMCTTFVDAVRKCLKDGGYASKDREVESAGTFMVGINGKLFTVEADYQVAESIECCEAIGSGCAYAVGALHVLKRSTYPAEDIVLEALKAAEAHCCMVHGPFTLVRS